MIKLHGAKVSYNDNDEKEFAPRGEIAVREDAILAYYDHAILMDRHTIYVMETMQELEALMGS